MTSSSSDAVVLRGEDAAAVLPARLHGELRTHRFLRGQYDPRLLDPALEQAFHDATDQARSTAEASGYAAGYASGRAAALRDVAEQAAHDRAVAEQALRLHVARLEHAAAVLGQAAEDLSRRAGPAYEQLADRLGPAAWQLVHTLLGRELELRPETVVDAVRRALAATPAEAELTVVLHPDDARELAGVADDDGIDVAGLLGRELRIGTDPALARGHVLARHGATTVDATLLAAMERVRKVLAP